MGDAGLVTVVLVALGIMAEVRSEELEVRSGGAAHKLRSAASLESQRI